MRVFVVEFVVVLVLVLRLIQWKLTLPLSLCAPLWYPSLNPPIQPFTLPTISTPTLTATKVLHHPIIQSARPVLIHSSITLTRAGQIRKQCTRPAAGLRNGGVHRNGGPRCPRDPTIEMASVDRSGNLRHCTITERTSMRNMVTVSGWEVVYPRWIRLPWSPVELSRGEYKMGCAS